MKSAEEKAEEIRARVLSKVEWGADEDEIAEWLEEEGVTEAEADALIKEAFEVKSKSYRWRAFAMLLISAIGVVVFVLFYLKQFQTGIRASRVQTVGVGVLGAICVVMFLRSLSLLFSRTSKA